MDLSEYSLLGWLLHVLFGEQKIESQGYHTSIHILLTTDADARRGKLRCSCQDYEGLRNERDVQTKHDGAGTVYVPARYSHWTTYARSSRPLSGKISKCCDSNAIIKCWFILLSSLKLSTPTCSPAAGFSHYSLLLSPCHYQAGEWSLLAAFRAHSILCNLGQDIGQFSLRGEGGLVQAGSNAPYDGQVRSSSERYRGSDQGLKEP